MAIFSNLGIQLIFDYPQFIIGLVLIPIFVFIYLFGMFYKNKRTIDFPNFEALRRTGLTEVHSRNTFYLYMFMVIILCLVLSLAGTRISFNSNSGDYSYVLAVDNSDSMRAKDLEPDRLSVSKIAAKNFISNLPMGVKVGVITFSGDVKIVSSLDNYKLGHLGKIDSIDFSDVAGTNIRDAVLLGGELLKKEKAKSIIIISDGQINLGNLSETIEYAQDNSLVINTIAIGTVSGGDTGYGFISKTDELTLKSLAFNTNGRFFSVTNTREMNISFDEMLSNSAGRIEINISYYLLMLTIILITLYWVLYNFRFRNFP
ncbi:MAG: VWA domain-containing protein [Nanoarchaeota archaeon]